MKARGYDPSTIAAAQEQSKRWAGAQRIIGMIREAFAGVTLGNGVGLRQTRALDDYADEATCAAIRAGDEKDDWQRSRWRNSTPTRVWRSSMLRECVSTVLRFSSPSYMASISSACPPGLPT